MIVNINNKTDIPDSIPFDAINIIDNVNIIYGNEQINPETIPRKYKILSPVNPHIKAPNKTDIIKYKVIKSDISGNLDNMNDNMIDNINDTKTPITEDINIPVIILTGVFN